MFDVYYDDLDNFEFEAFEKFKRGPKTGHPLPVKTNDHQIRTARRMKEKVKQAALAEIEIED